MGVLYFVWVCYLSNFNFAIILLGKRVLLALLKLPSCCHLAVSFPFLPVPCVGLQFVIMAFPADTHLRSCFIFVNHIGLYTFYYIGTFSSVFGLVVEQICEKSCINDKNMKLGTWPDMS